MLGELQVVRIVGLNVSVAPLKMEGGKVTELAFAQPGSTLVLKRQ